MFAQGQKHVQYDPTGPDISWLAILVFFNLLWSHINIRSASLGNSFMEYAIFFYLQTQSKITYFECLKLFKIIH